MPSRRVTPQEKKIKGTFNVTRDKDTEFEIKDGLMTMIPPPPDDYDDGMVDVWKKYWRHLVKHQYGKESDAELMDLTIRSWRRYHHFRTFDLAQADKAADKFMKGLEQLGISPTAMAKVAILQKSKPKLTPAEIARQKAQ
jgi:phage terminase small subunit